MTRILSFVLVFLLSSTTYASGDACSATSGASALVIIDMQPYFVNRNGTNVANTATNKQKVEAVLKEQMVAIEKAKAANVPIILVEYDFQGIDKTDERLQSAVAGYRNTAIIKKDTDGMFDKDNKHLRQLKNFLKMNNIGTLLMTGANGGACVRQSIVGALANNCNVVSYSGAIADFNYKEFVYPYVGKYSDVVAKCESCYFKEVAKADSLDKYMISNEPADPVVKTKNSGANKNKEGRR